MSHQSTMTTVVPYFERWMKSFPSLEILARASEASVLEAWAGLGYYSRARNVHRAAQTLASYRREHGGNWPEELSEWLSLPGVGPYSAAAITAICFGNRTLPLDGNVIRVLSRYFKVPDPLNQKDDRIRVQGHLDELAQRIRLNRHGDVAQSLMELGAMICRPGPTPACEVCPLASGCGVFREGEMGVFPRAKKRQETHKIRTLALIYRNRTGGVLLRHLASPKSRLAGQWELPLWELPVGLGEFWLKSLRGHFEVAPRPVKHAITKHLYEVYGVESGLWRGTLPESHAFWVPGTSPPGTLTTLTRKILLI